MLKAARLYYEDDRTQAEVARVLKTSRPTVSRLLQQARDEGIVQIRIADPSATSGALADELIAAFDLADATVVAVGDAEHALVRRRIGQAAARYLERTLHDGDLVGIGWGRTLYEMVSALEPGRPARAGRRRRTRISVAPLLGGLGQIAPVFQVHELARTLAEAFGGTWHSFYAPALAESDEMAKRLLGSADLQQVSALWQQLNVAVVGIGNADFESGIQMLFVNYLDADTQQRLLAARAVGDICVRFFDAHGRPCPDVVRGVVGAELGQLQRARRVVGVAGGDSKAEAILGALRGRFVNALITDEVAARRVLALHRQAAAT